MCKCPKAKLSLTHTDLSTNLLLAGLVVSPATYPIILSEGHLGIPNRKHGSSHAYSLLCQEDLLCQEYKFLVSLWNSHFGLQLPSPMEQLFGDIHGHCEHLYSQFCSPKYRERLCTLGWSNSQIETPGPSGNEFPVSP